jgi:hypothetical protein
MPSIKEILTVLLLRLLPVLVVLVLACRWLGSLLSVPASYLYWINLLGVLLVSKVIAGPLFLRMYRADRAGRTRR